jgi:hypothetical protein
MATMSVGEYANVHWRPAGSLPVGEVNERLSEAVPPGDTAADDKTRVSV